VFAGSRQTFSAGYFSRIFFRIIWHNFFYNFRGKTGK